MLRLVFWSLLTGVAVVIGVSLPWSFFAVLNLRVSPGVPWSIVAGAVYLPLAGSYLNGRGWPASTRESRRRCFRARWLRPAAWAWSLLAGFLAISALWLWFAAAGYLASPHSPGREAALPPVVLFTQVVIGAAVTALAEEGGCRGFIQAPLERLLGPVTAISITTVAFVLLHLSHGLSTLVRYGIFYLAAGCIYGILAYLTQSILPSLVLHFVGDIAVFSLATSLLRITGPEAGRERWLCAFVGLILGCLSVPAFLRLARVTIPVRSAILSA